MDVESPNRSSMKDVIQMAPQIGSKRSFRVAPGGNTTIEQCFNLV
jgi:hypothetical protein